VKKGCIFALQLFTNKPKTMTTLQITKNFIATIRVNEDGSVILCTIYNNDARAYFYKSIAEVIEYTTIPAVKNHFINN